MAQSTHAQISGRKKTARRRLALAVLRFWSVALGFGLIAWEYR